MGLINSIWKAISGKDQIDRFFSPLSTGDGEDGQTLEPDECYIELYIKSLRLKKARKFATTFNGVVYSFVTLPREGDKNADIASISKPARLADLDSNSLNAVITVDKQMMGSVAWRGGPLKLEIGLFSVKTGNLLTPVVDFVTRVSSTAGFSFVDSVKPFIPLLTEGMDMIAGQKDDTNLEVGLDTSLNLTKSGTYVIIDAEKTAIDPSKLKLDTRDGKLLLNGSPLAEAYCVFTIRRQAQKADYGEIPALKEKYDAILKAIRSGVQKDAEAALAAFRFEAIASQDLITSDARGLVKKAEDKIKAAFGGGGVSAPIGAKAIRQGETLADLGLYA
jgi:hypothetical protein